jgi:hypothetical protein
MATIILNYDNYNVQAQRALENILSSGFFKVEPIEKSRKEYPVNDNDEAFLYSVSEQMLAKDWLNDDEDKAWKDL